MAKTGLAHIGTFHSKISAPRSPYRKYDSLTVLDFETNCTYVRKSCESLRVGCKTGRRFADQAGFTLIELMLSIALMATIAGLTAGIYYTTQVKNGLDIAAATLVQQLRRAQSLAQNGDSDSGWGIYVQPGSITLFKGSTYASRDTTMDEVASFAANITPSGSNEVDFTKFTGDPSSTASFTLATTADTEIITVNSKGMVSP